MYTTFLYVYIRILDSFCKTCVRLPGSIVRIPKTAAKYFYYNIRHAQNGKFLEKYFFLGKYFIEKASNSGNISYLEYISGNIPCI